MITLSAKKMIKSWNHNTLSESVRFKYLIMSSLWITIGYYLPKQKSMFLWINRAEITTSIIITILGLLWVYNKNGGKKGERIIEKFILFSVPAAIKAFILSFVVMLIWNLLNEWVIVTKGNTIEINLAMDSLYLICINAVQIIYYGLLGSYVSQLRSDT